MKKVIAVCLCLALVYGLGAALLGSVAAEQAQRHNDRIEKALEAAEG